MRSLLSKMLTKRHDDLIQEEAQLARKLWKDHPDLYPSYGAAMRAATIMQSRSTGYVQRAGSRV